MEATSWSSPNEDKPNVIKVLPKGNESEEDGYTWEELQAIDHHRLNILGKVELPFLRVLLSWKGTCMNVIFLDPMMILPIAVFLLIRVLARSGTEVSTSVVEALGNPSVDILGGFLSFFLVLFVNQTNSRFFDMYALSRACAGRIQDVAGYASARLPPEEAHRLLRYMNAAHISGYIALNGPYKRKNFFEPYNAKYRMLQPEELAKFDGIPMDGCADMFKELCTWCQKDLALSLKAGYIDSYEANEIHKRILDLRAHMDGIHDTCFQPPHFFYIHFLCILTLLYLPLFAINNACAVGWEDFHWSVEFLAGCVVVLQCFFVIGLRVLGQKMIDPYGDDYEDLSVITFVSAGLDISRIMLNANDQGRINRELEQSLRKRPLKRAKLDSKATDPNSSTSTLSTGYLYSEGIPA